MIDRTYREKGYKMHNEKAESREGRNGMGRRRSDRTDRRLEGTLG